MKAWIRQCTAAHEGCMHAARPLYDRRLPTRPLDTGPLDDLSPHFRIVSTTEMDSATTNFAALSHCWGPHPLLRTLTTNFNAHCHSIAASVLPKSFVEAAAVARNLRIRYLWIDSLCIIQDLSSDWEREAATMGSVYSNAELTIAATGASDGTKGLFLQRPEMEKPVRIPYRDGTIHLAMPTPRSTGEIDNSPLDARASITQEWLLSSRVLHFTEAQMVWSCVSTTESEDGRRMYTTEPERLRELLAWSGIGPLEELEASEMHEDRAYIVQSYCSRNLTYLTDRPVATAGFAQVLENRWTERYHHGPWFPADAAREFDPGQLLWYGKPPDTGSSPAATAFMLASDPRAVSRPGSLAHIPTWSWQSVLGRIGYYAPTDHPRSLVSLVSVGQDEKELGIEAVCFPLHWPVFGPVKGDTNLGARYPYTSHFSLSATGLYVYPHGMYLLGSDEERIGWVSVDLQRVPQKNEEVWCCAVSCNVVDGGRKGGVNVLLLRRLGKGKFSRLGMGELLDYDSVMEKEKISVRIV